MKRPWTEIIKIPRLRWTGLPENAPAKIAMTESKTYN
jgi:hypothetical protein